MNRAFAEEASDLSKRFHDHKSEAEAYNHLGVAYNNEGNNQESFTYFLKALKIMERIHDEDGIANSYVNLGQANFYLDDFDKALEYFQKALAVRERIGGKSGVSQSLILIGNVMAKTARYDEALDHYFKALTIKEEIDDKIGISQICNNLGNIYSETKQSEKALEYRLKALQTDRELGNKWEIANTTFNIAEGYLEIDQPEKAYPYILESQEIANELQNKGLMRDNLHNLSLYYELRGEYQKALNYQRDYSEATKSLFSEELSEKITEMQIQYETEKLEELVAERTHELQQKINDLERTGKALRESEERFDLAVTGADLGLWDWDTRTGKATYNRQWSEMLGYSIEEIEPRSSSWKNLVHPDDEQQMMEAVNAHFEGKTPVYEAEFRMRTKSGEWKWIQTTGKVVVRDDDGRPLRMTGLNRDITERKRAEEALRRGRDLAKALAEATAALTSTLDFERVLDVILNQVSQVVPNDATNIMLIEDDQARIVRGRGYERFGTEEFVSTVVFHIPEADNLRQMLESKEPVVIPDTATYPGWFHLPKTKWLRSYAASPIIVRDEVIGFLNVDSATPSFFTQAHAKALRTFAAHAAATIENARLYEKVQQELTERKQAEEALRLSFIQLAETVSRAMESQDPYTAGHQRQVAELARMVGEKLGLEPDRLQGIYIASLLHDIGKISIPAEILTHPGKLSDVEWTLIRTHPRRGYEILEQVEFPWPVADIALHHHERLDGTGYPDGLKGDELSLEVRILGVCDVVDAMSSNRPYRPARPKEMVIEELLSGRGTRYDEKVVDIMLGILEGIGIS